MEAEFDLIESRISGNNIIEASAGTGKTYSIEGLYIRILLQPYLDKAHEGIQRGVENILVVTYTEAATTELRLRILEKLRLTLKGFQIAKSLLQEEEKRNPQALRSALIELKDQFILDLITSILPEIDQKGTGLLQNISRQLKSALLSFDEAAIFTIHGFCKRMLSDYSLESRSGFEFDFTKNQQHIIDECVNDHWRNQVYQSNQQYVDLLLSYFETPSKITDHLKPVLNKPYAIILPSDKPLLKGWFDDLMTQFQSLKQSWLENRSEIEKLIQDNSKKFKKNYLDKTPILFEEMDYFFSSNSPHEIPAISKNLTPPIIAGATRVRIDPINHDFFEEFEPFYDFMGTLKAKLVAEFIPRLIGKLQKRKEILNILSFDDLLMNLKEALKGKGGRELENKISKRFHIALIDEFQDTDPIQYEIFNRLFHNKVPLFLIGDPKQSIYNFRGADIFAYFKAVHDADDKKHLKTNYRSCKDLVRAFNTIFSNHGGEGKFVFDDKIKYIDSEGSPTKPDRLLIVDDEEPAPFQFWFLRDIDTNNAAEIRGKILQATVSEIVRLLNLGVQNRAIIKTDSDESPGKPVEPRDIAILVSSHKEANRLQEALRERGVPSIQRGTRNIFETKEFFEIKLLLKGVYEYHRESALRPVFVTEFFENQSEGLLDLFNDEVAWEKIIDQFQELNHIWQKRGLFAMMQSFMEQERIRENFLRFEDGERKLSNLIQLAEILQRAQLENQLDAQGLIHWMEMIEQNPEEYEDNEIRLETDDEALSILTVHSSKGLQFPIVFCPYSWSTGKNLTETMFHDPENEDRLTLDLLKTQYNKDIASNEKVAEQIRLAYVAFTRAKACCYIAWGKIGGSKNSCYSRLFHQNFKNSKSTSFTGISVDDYWSDLKDLEQRSKGSILVSDLPDGRMDNFESGLPEDLNLTVHELDKKLISDSRIYSFTGLTKKENLYHAESDIAKEDNGEVDSDEAPPAPIIETVLSDFPGGTNTGNFFHDILENTDFHAPPADEMITTKLAQYGFSNDLKGKAVELVELIRSLPLNSDFLQTGSHTFASIPSKQVIKEMPFYFALNRVNLSRARQLVKDCEESAIHTALLNSLEFIDFNRINGFMKGFIDMVFCCEGRYYILDWKTNHLGDRADSYSKEQMELKINDYHYNLQYIIYTVALHKYLKTRIPDYKFETHFGGIYYIFLRGLNDREPESGVYYQSLAESKAVIEGLDALFVGGAND
ncbi:MAG: exodeoxyribonuclease V subunit beta [Proteobacteria bacterium]|nr:exodeoxyribonuclease V subunit beta [Pseudomonadota bacterium]